MCPEKTSALKKFYISIRPWSYPASVMPVIFGTTLAVTIGKAALKPGLFFLSLLAMVVLHSGSNVLSDINDWNMGLDTEITAVSGGIVRRYISTQIGWILGLGLLGFGCALGLVIVYLTTIEILYIGMVGVAIGFFYTIAPIALKYHALGDFAVFMDFGILGSLGAWTVQTGQVSSVAVLWAVPIAMLVAGILHANNWRDLQSDKSKNISTIASILGDSGSETYYGVLIFGPFVYVLLTILLTQHANVLYKMPHTCVLVFGALPEALKLWKRARKRNNPIEPMDFILLDKDTATLNAVFGALYILSLILGKLI